MNSFLMEGIQTSLINLFTFEKNYKFIYLYKEFKNAKKLLDLAGVHGLYAIGFSMLNKT